MQIREYANLNKFLSWRLILVLLALSALGVGCVQFGGGGASTVADGGVWKSADKGITWVQKVLIPTTAAQKRSIGATNVITFALDPEDRKAVYIGTVEQGMFYTLDGGENWQTVAALKGKIPSITVDPGDKCTVYAATENKIQRTTDCTRTWASIYYETRTDKIITALALNPRDGKIILAGNSAGDLNISSDGGNSWATVQRFKSEVKKIFVAPYDTKIIYAATKSSGIWRSKDGGATWNDISEGFKQFSGAFEYKDMVLDLSAPETILYASQFGILRGTDGGAKWQKVELLTPPGSAAIYSMAVNPQDGKEIYYGTATTFYSSIDGGAKWKTRKLPSSRAATAMIVDPSAPNVLYLGVTSLKQ